jgi:hypothetical protein
LLGFRTTGFLVVQAIIAGLLALVGSAAPWHASAAWWQLSAAVTSVATVALLVVLLRREGSSYLRLFRVDRATVGMDLLVLLGTVVVVGLLGWLPSPGLSWLLYGDTVEGARRMFQPLPLWGAAAAIAVFPVTIGLSELPFYFGYLMPRLPGPRWLAILAAGGALSAQHATLPLLLDGPFVVWRLLTFLPMALVLGAVLAWRPRLLPWLCVVHTLSDLSAAIILWQVSSGHAL